MAARASKVRTRIRKNDLVMVINGRDRGKTGKVIKVVPETGRLLIERLNVVKRHSRPRGAASPGGIVEREAPIDLASVMIFCERCNAPVRVGVKIAADQTKTRVCRRCGESIGNE